jgi:hypothetical protein
MGRCSGLSQICDMRGWPWADSNWGVYPGLILGASIGLEAEEAEEFTSVEELLCA